MIGITEVYINNNKDKKRKKEKCNSILSDAKIAKRKKVHLYMYHYQILSMKSNVKLLSELNLKLIIFRKVYQYYLCLKILKAGSNKSSGSNT
mgnify:CR=1 FL=1